MFNNLIMKVNEFNLNYSQQLSGSTRLRVLIRKPVNGIRSCPLANLKRQSTFPLSVQMSVVVGHKLS